jgi:hypothetical protein
MGRTVDQEVHAAFVEFRAKEDDKVRDLYFRNISTTRFTVVTNKTPCLLGCSAVSFGPVYLLPANSRKEYIAPEAAPARVSRTSRSESDSTICAQRHQCCKWIPCNSEWCSCHGTWRWPRAWHRCTPDSQRTDDDERRQPTCYLDADSAAEHARTRCVADSRPSHRTCLCY